MHFFKCKCGPLYHVRIPRQWWMRIFMGRRLYYGCEGCGVKLFIRPPPGGWDPEATMKPRQAADLAGGTRNR